MGGSRTSNYERQKGHKPIATVRDKDVFSMIAGVSQAVTATAKNAINRSITSDPLNNNEDSLFVGNLLTTGEFENKSYNSSIDNQGLGSKFSGTGKIGTPAEKQFVQRLKMRESIPEQLERDNQDDSVLSIAENSLDVSKQPSFAINDKLLSKVNKGRLDMVYTAAQPTDRRKFSSVANRLM